MTHNSIDKEITVISSKRVAEVIGIHLSTLNRWVKEGGFPPPIRLGRARVGWRLGDIEAWLSQKATTLTTA